jgi:hypothetical protein
MYTYIYIPKKHAMTKAKVLNVLVSNNWFYIVKIYTYVEKNMFTFQTPGVKKHLALLNSALKDDAETEPEK